MLTFPICATCADLAQTTTCTHSTEERAWVGVFTIRECNRALTLDYMLLEIYEILRFKNTEKYDRNVPGSGIYATFISDLYRLKVENSGYPKGVETEEQKAEYKRSMEEYDGIKLAKLRTTQQRRV